MTKNTLPSLSTHVQRHLSVNVHTSQKNLLFHVCMHLPKGMFPSLPIKDIFPSLSAHAKRHLSFIVHTYQKTFSLHYLHMSKDIFPSLSAHTHRSFFHYWHLPKVTFPSLSTPAQRHLSFIVLTCPKTDFLNVPKGLFHICPFPH